MIILFCDMDENYKFEMILLYGSYKTDSTTYIYKYKKYSFMALT